MFMTQDEKPEPKPVRVIGCGMIAQFHAKAIADLDNAKLVACYDMAGDRAKAFGEEQGCAAQEPSQQARQGTRCLIALPASP